MNKISFLILISFLVFSCKKDTDTTQSKPSASSKMLLSKVKVGGKTASEFFYDNKQQLQEYRQYEFSGNLVQTIKYTYNSQGQISKSENLQGNNTIISAFAYDAQDRPLKRTYDYKDASGKIVKAVDSLEYNSVSQITKAFYLSDSQLDGYSTYEYDSSQKNVLSEKYFFIKDKKAVLESQWGYDFDKKRNPYQIFGYFFSSKAGINMNNSTIIIETLKMSSVAPQTTIIRGIVYEYNSTDFPIKQTINGQIITFEYL
ncbi:MAG: hypothetical protein EAZ97_03845 [Bacteroidetes bacterium]|nr:MAG: hypothetical protein EAZ97_03845 [Bacteroidota bacterium]